MANYDQMWFLVNRIKKINLNLVHQNLKAHFSGISAKPELFPLLSFLVPIIVRSVPEIFMGSYVVGFDTLGYYIPNTIGWLQTGIPFWTFIAEAPLFYVLLMGLTSIGIPIAITLKLLSPLLLGLLGLTVYFYASNTLSWSTRKSLLAVFFATLYFVALRISWDMLRSELALIFMFLALMFINEDKGSLRNTVLLFLAMVSVVFTHQLVTVIMFAIVIVALLTSFLHKQTINLRRLIVCFIPAVALFLLIVYGKYVASSAFSVFRGFTGQESEGFLALFGFASYFDMVIDTLGFLIFCYLPIVPLLLLGARKFKGNLQIKVWISWIFISLVLVIISPNALFPVYPYRWTLLLTYPLAFYAASGFADLKLEKYKIFVGVLLVALSLSFTLLPNNLAFPYYALYGNYFPSSMLQNTVALSDARDTVNAIDWAQNNMRDDSKMLVHDAFYGWALLSFDRSRLVPYGYANPETVARDLCENHSDATFYLVWWINGTGWHGQQNVSSSFEQVYESGNIAVYVYTSSHTTNTDFESTKILNRQSEYLKYDTDRFEGELVSHNNLVPVREAFINVCPVLLKIH